MSTATEIRCSRCLGNVSLTPQHHEKGKLQCPFCDAAIVLPYVPLFTYKNANVAATVARSEARWQIQLSHSVAKQKKKTQIEIETRTVDTVTVRTITVDGKVTKTKRPHIHIYRSETNPQDTLFVTIDPGDNRPQQIFVDNEMQQRWLCNALRYIINEFDDTQARVEQRCGNCSAVLYREVSAAAYVNCPFCDAGFVSHAAEEQVHVINLPHIESVSHTNSKEVVLSSMNSGHLFVITPLATRQLLRNLFKSVFRVSVLIQLLLMIVVIIAPTHAPIHPQNQQLLLLCQSAVLMLGIGYHSFKALGHYLRTRRQKWRIRISDESISLTHIHLNQSKERQSLQLSQLQYFYFSRNNTPFVHLVARTPIEEMTVPFFLNEKDCQSLQYELVNAMKKHLPAAGRKWE